MKRLLLILSLALFSACSPNTMIEKFADKAKQQIARNYIQRVIDGDTAALANELDPTLRSDKTAAAFEQMRAAIPQGAPTVTNLVGYNVFHPGNGGTQYNLTYQFGYGSRWLLMNAAWREMPDGSRQIIGLRVQPLPSSLQEINGLSLKHAGPRHYLFMAGAIAVPVFILGTLITCIRTKIPRLKWLWILFILVGLVRISINWTTGKVSISALAILLFGASAMASSIYSPWIVSFALPIGAAIFWLRRSRLSRQGSGVPASPES